MQSWRSGEGGLASRRSPAAISRGRYTWRQLRNSELRPLLLAKSR
jgi:hypothetical protein